MPTHEEFRSMSYEDLVKGYNDNITSQPDLRNMLSAQSYRDEIVRREQDKATQAMLVYTKEVCGFTKQMKTMTVIILVATIFGAVATILGVLHQFSII